MFSGFFERLLASLGIAFRMFREIIFRFISRIIFTIRSTLSIVNLAGRKIPNFLQSLAGLAKKPTSKNDYIETKRMFISKSFVIMLIGGIIVFAMLWHIVLWPFIVSRFLTIHLWAQDDKLSEYTGKVVLYEDKKKEHPIFQGRYEKGKAEGYGVCFDDKGMITFEGNYSGGVRKGQGTIYMDGIVTFKGTLDDDAFEGLGSLYTENGTLVYSGNFHESKYDGNGILYYSNGNVRYSGGFKEGNYDGSGRLFNGSGGMIYSGGFKNNLYEGRGKLYDEARVIYDGSFSAGLREGKGRAYENGELLYDGEWADDRFNGEGIEYYENGSQLYTGGFKDGLFSGSGVYFAENDVIISGSFENGYVKDKAVCSYEGMKFYEGGMNRLTAEGVGTAYTTQGTESYKGEFLLWNPNGGTLLDQKVAEIRERFRETPEEILGETEFCLNYPTLGLALTCSYADADNEALVRAVYLSQTPKDQTFRFLRWETPKDYEEAASRVGRRNDAAWGMGIPGMSSLVPIPAGRSKEKTGFRAYPQSDGSVIVLWVNGTGAVTDRINYAEWIDRDAADVLIDTYAEHKYLDRDEADKGASGSTGAAGSSASGGSAGSTGAGGTAGGTGTAGGSGAAGSGASGGSTGSTGAGGSGAAGSGASGGSAGSTGAAGTGASGDAGSTGTSGDAAQGGTEKADPVKEITKQLGLEEDKASTESSKLIQLLNASKADGSEYLMLNSFLEYVGGAARKDAAEQNIKIYEALIEEEKKRITVGKGSKKTLEGYEDSLRKLQEQLSDEELSLIELEKSIMKASGRTPAELEPESAVFVTDPEKFDKEAIKRAIADSQMKAADEKAAEDKEKKEAEEKAKAPDGGEEKAEESKPGETDPNAPGGTLPAVINAEKVLDGTPVKTHVTGQVQGSTSAKISAETDNAGPVPMEAKEDPNNLSPEEKKSQEQEAEEAAEEEIFQPDMSEIGKKTDLNLRKLVQLYKDINSAKDDYKKALEDRTKTEANVKTGKSTAAELKLKDTAVNDAKAALINSCIDYSLELSSLNEETGGYISKEMKWFDSVYK